MTTFWKGHGTGNDFVIVDQQDPLTSAQVRWLCHRRFGIGADGTLQALRSGDVEDWNGDPDLWFMDYRNADGTIAEMCGNGLRVFARYLVQTGRMTTTEADVATRAGVRHVRLHDDGDVSVTMGTVRVESDEVTIEHQDMWWPACKVDVGNPHAVVVT
ncbi:MAG: diaminopimelate epimerase, partial [Cutibacterium sp.]